MNKLQLLLILFITFYIHCQAQNLMLARTPDFNPDGSKIAFSYQGDIWTAKPDGSEPQRVTIHEAYEYNPRWSPDGTEIAFSSNRYGNDDIFVISFTDGGVRRLTHHSADDVVSSWTPDGDILFTSIRDYRTIEREFEIMVIPGEGGTPNRIIDALGYDPIMSPDGSKLAFVSGSCRISREAYQGPANRNIWIYDFKEDSYKQTSTSKANDFMPRWVDNERLIYISAASGKYNLVLQHLDDSTTIEITNLIENSVRHFGLSLGGNIIYESGASLFTTDLDANSSLSVPLTIIRDYRFDPEEQKTYTNNISAFAVSPNERLIALEIHGELFITENDEDKSKTVNVTKNPARDMDPCWLNDSMLIFSSDRDGQFDLYLVKSSDSSKTDLFKSLKHEIIKLTNSAEEEVEPILSPDGSGLAYRQGRGKFLLSTVDTLTGQLSDTRSLLNGWASPEDMSWSPDSKWLAYSLSDLYFNDEVFIHPVDNSSEAINISMHPKSDHSPVWSPDGSKLGFISDRNNGDDDIWFVWLQKEDWEKTKEDREEGYYFEKTTEEEEIDSTIQIDIDNIYRRLVQVTGNAGDERHLAIAGDNETFLFSASNPAEDSRELYSIKFDGTDVKQVTKGGTNPNSLRLGPKGEKLYYLKGGRLNTLNKEAAKSTSIPHSAIMTINHTEERAQVFEEAWRALEQGFYDPDFHGRDWVALKEKYKPWAMAASTQQDFRYIFNLMLGQLNASHMGLYGSDPEDTQSQRTGLLGAEFEPRANGLRVKRVLPYSPAAKAKSQLEVGDIVLAVAGQTVNQNVNIYQLLNNKIDQQVLLEVEKANGETTEIAIRPTNSLSSQRYEEWVESRKKLTDQYSGGRLGYIHIRGMNWTSFERFERELMASGYGKEGIVIDVRYNGGGWTTDYLMSVLNVRQHAYTIPRGAAVNLASENPDFQDYYPFAERLPLSSWTKPSIALCNQNSYSNAEIFSHAYKTLGIGTLVGQPTFGAVISTGSHSLIDGSYVRMPFRAWYVKATGENMEHGPAIPDILIENSPDSRSKGRDEQLQKAVEVLLEQIGE